MSTSCQCPGWFVLLRRLPVIIALAWVLLTATPAEDGFIEADLVQAPIVLVEDGMIFVMDVSIQ